MLPGPMTAAGVNLDDPDAECFAVTLGHTIVEKLHETVKVFRRARLGVFIDRFIAVAVLVAKDSDRAGEDDAFGGAPAVRPRRDSLRP